MNHAKVNAPPLRLPRAFIRRTTWSGADLTGADLTGADAANADFVDVNFENARLKGTNLRGADLSGARNLTHQQLAEAIIDETTRLPGYIDRHRLSDSRLVDSKNDVTGTARSDIAL